ncbi:MAG: hypothetical protein ACHQ49_06625 [Elusimicrobiota bacterium]
MKKNMTVSLLTGIILSLAAYGAAAQSALQQLGAEAGVDAAPLTRQFAAAREDAAHGPVGIPLHRKDVFATCSAIDSKPFLPWNASQAAVVVQTCLNNFYPADAGFSVRAQAARFGHRCPNGGSASCRAIVEVVGIKITVSGRILTGNPVFGDLNFTLKNRGNKLLGFEAIVDDQAILH